MLEFADKSLKTATMTIFPMSKKLSEDTGDIKRTNQTSRDTKYTGWN